MRFFLIVFSLFILGAATGCKKEFEGDRTDPGYPETFMAVDSIYRSGDTRYTTTVRAHWWGVVRGGFIRGYEVSLDNSNWKFTTSQDSLFLLSLPAGSDTADIRIYVRAIDNEGRVDPTPASTAYPVKNTPPTIAFDYTFGRKTKTFPAFRLNWKPADIDGLQDIDAIELVLNDTGASPLRLASGVTAATFTGDKAAGTFNGAFTVYVNAQTTPLQQKLTGGKYNDYNFVYIRSIDRSGARSEWVKDSIFIMQPGNGLLFINQHQNKSRTTPFYNAMLDSLGASYAGYDIINSVFDELPSDEFTTRKMFEYFNRIVWVTDEAMRTLALAQQGTESFFTANGRMLLIMEIPNDVQPDADVFSFTPIQRLVPDSLPGRAFRMTTGDQLTAYDPAWPVLRATEIITYPRPFYTYTQPTGRYSYDSLARAQLRSFGPGGAPLWGGSSNVMSKRINTSANETDMIVLTVPLHSLNGNNNAASFFKKAVLEELKF